MLVLIHTMMMDVAMGYDGCDEDHVMSGVDVYYDGDADGDDDDMTTEKHHLFLPKICCLKQS